MQKYAKKFAYIKNLLYLCTRFQKQTNQRWRQHHKNGNRFMTLTSYTKYVLNQGETIRVYLVSLDRPTPSQLCAQLNCDAKYDETKGQWYVVMTKDNWQAKFKALRGRQMNFFTMEH